MDELCVSCLCGGRNLSYISDTETYQLFAQILNEIPLYDLSQICIRICWECAARLQNFQMFKTQVKSSYTELLQHLHQNTSKLALPRPSRLQTRLIYNTSFPILIKKEFDSELHMPDLFTVCVKSEEDHCEPETFVEEVKQSKEKKKKTKVKKKIKLKNKNKKVKNLPESPINDIDNTEFHSDYDGNEIEEDKEKFKVRVVVEGENVKDEKHICQICGSVFDEGMELDNHFKTEHSEKRVSKSEKAVKKVVVTKEVVNEKPQCVECGKTFSSRKTYRYHLNVLHKGQNRYPCPRCGKVYQWKSNLGRHMRTHKARDSDELYCDMCDKRFASIATYRQHLRISRRHISESEFSFSCNDCGKKFVNKTRLRDHIDWEHLNKIKFRCLTCDKPFKCHTSLYVHMQNVHRDKDKKDNLCHVCGKSYQNAAKLKYHIVAMHTHETPYRCEQCGASFGWYSSLYRHIREVHYKMKQQPKRSKKMKKIDILPPGHPQQLPLANLHAPPP